LRNRRSEYAQEQTGRKKLDILQKREVSADVRMKPKNILPIFFSTGLLLACICPLSTLPLMPSAPTPQSLPATPTPEKTTTPPPVSQTETPFTLAWEDRSPFEKNLVSSYQSILKGLPGASIYHIAISISDPPTQVEGVEEIRYTNTEKVSLSEVDFAVFPEILGGSISIDRLTVDSQSFSATHQNGLMRIPLAVPLHPDESITFHIEFRIIVPTLGGDYYYGIFGYNDGILSLAHVYPTILVYNEQGWNNQSPDLDGDPLFSDISFYLVSIDAPADLMLVASGVEVNRQETTDRQRVLFADGPARDFYLAASKNFAKQTEKIGETTFTSYAPANLSQYAKSAIKAAEAAIDDFSRRYAPYPYTEFDIVPIVTSAGGVEFPGMTALGEHIYNQSDFLEAVVAHEVAHQWFYNLVGNETQMQPWLDESLAQYVSCQYYLDKNGEQAEQSCLNAMQSRWDRLTDQKIPIGKPVSAYTSDEYGAIVYGRGPFFFVALREQIGQVAFDGLLHDYAISFAWEIATTDSFKQLAEFHCNCNLTPLFTEWVYP
jgi:hypothetical protein